MQTQVKSVHKEDSNSFNSILKNFFLPAGCLVGMTLPVMVIMSKAQGGWLQAGLIGLTYWLLFAAGYWLPIGVLLYRWKKGAVTRFFAGYALSIPLFFLTLALVYKALGADFAPKSPMMWGIYFNNTVWFYVFAYILFLLVRKEGKKARVVKNLSMFGFVVSCIMITGLAVSIEGYHWPGETTRAARITNAKIVLASENRILNGYNVHVENGIISEIVAAGNDTSSLPGIDAGGGYLIPGLIDAHTHLQVPVKGVEAGFDVMFLLESFLRDYAPHRKAYLEHGITTIRDTGDPAIKSFAIRDALQKKELLGPRQYTVGRLVTAPNGHPVSTIWTSIITNQAAILAGDETEMIAGLEKNYVQGPPDAIKVVYGTINRPVERLRLELLQAAINWANDKNLISIVHAETTEEVGAAAAAGATGIEHAASIEMLPDTLLSLLIANKPFISPTFGELVFAIKLMNPENPAALLQQKYGYIKKMFDAGVPLAIGTDAPLLPYGEGYLDEMQHYLNAGLTPAEILLIATENNAAYLGAQNELGKIALGYKADMVLLSANPLEDLAALGNPLWVMLDGQIVVANR